MTAPLVLNRAAIEYLAAIAVRDSIAVRGIEFNLPAPQPMMRACVVVPVRNEETTILSLLESLAGQLTADGKTLDQCSYEVILLLNNCTDQTREVAEAFEVPLTFFLDPGNHQRNTLQYQGRTRHYYAMPFEKRYIWGATAGMLMNFYAFLTA